MGCDQMANPAALLQIPASFMFNSPEERPSGRDVSNSTV